MAHTITVIELLQICRKQISEGNGSKKILLSNDDEGNGYHELFYGMGDTEFLKDDRTGIEIPWNIERDDLDSYVTLG